MEPTESTLSVNLTGPKLRHRLILGKYQVTSVETGLTGLRFSVNFGNSVVVKIDSPVNSDVRVGDWLTFYTEVMAHADAGSTSIQ